MVPSKSSSQTAGGAILDLHVLNGDFQVLVLKSNGELRLVDTRGAQRKEKDSNVVVEYAAGGSNTYLPMLKCAVVGEDWEETGYGVFKLEFNSCCGVCVSSTGGRY